MELTKKFPGKVNYIPGNHDELMKKEGFYAELYNSQFEILTIISFCDNIVSEELSSSIVDTALNQ